MAHEASVCFVVMGKITGGIDKVSVFTHSCCQAMLRHMLLVMLR